MNRSWSVCSLLFLIVLCIMLSGCGGGSGGNRSTDPGTTPDANTLYVAGPNSVTAYTIGSTGTLTQQGTVTGIDAPDAAVVSPDGKTLAISNHNGVTVSTFRINKTTGALAAAPGSPADSGVGGGYPLSLAFSPNNSYLYLGRTVFADDLDVFTVDASTSALALVGSPADPGFSGTSGVAVHPDGSHVYFYGHGIAVYQNNGGILVPVNGSPFLTDQNFTALAISPNGNYLLAGGGNLSLYRVTNGLPEAAPLKTVLGQDTITDIAFSADGSRAFVLSHDPAPNGAGRFIDYAVTVNSTSGNITLQNAIIGNPSIPTSLTLDSTGKFVYWINIQRGLLEGVALTSATTFQSLGVGAPTTGVKLAASR